MIKPTVIWWARIWRRWPNKPLGIHDAPTPNLELVIGAAEFEEIEVVRKSEFDALAAENETLRSNIADLLLLHKARKN